MSTSIQSRKKRILVVEDDRSMIEVHLHFLSDYLIALESFGTDAIWYVQNTRDQIDFALIDIQLPDISGIEVLQEIKKIMPSVPAIVITGHSTEEIAITSLRLGVVDYIKKPFNYSDLLTLIQFYLSDDETPTEKSCTLSIKKPDEVGDFRMQQAIRFIHENYFLDIRLEQVADAASVSKFHFSRIFKETTGLTFQIYLHHVRISRARKLLDNPFCSVTEAGYSTGYNDLTHFERVFKKLVGSTPTQYRANRQA